MTEVIFATHNKHKLEEVRSILGPDFRVLSLSDIGCPEELPETQDTIEGNAAQKARYVFENFGKPCFADDSGLEVPALNGEPGVRSARYAGPHGDSEENMKLLLRNLEGAADRAARFKTIIAVIDRRGDMTLLAGVVRGTILTGKRGTEGFGYDPLFVPDGYTLTFAEMPSGLKNTISHRALATQKLAQHLQEIHARN